MINRDALISQGCVMHWTGEKATANSPKAITSVGDEQILPFSGAGIGMFDGNGDILTCGITSDWSFLAEGTWTIECWFYVSSYGDFTFISTYDPDAYTTLLYRCDNTGKIFYGFCAPTGGWWNLYDWYGSGTYLLNAWNHVVMVRNGNNSNSTIQCFLNGVLDRTFNIGNTLLKTPTSPLAIGSYCSIYPTYFNGYMSEIRVSNIARYTTNFTPPRRQLESDEHTKLLLHFNRNDSTFVDSSPSAHTITAYGNATQLTSPFVGDVKQILPFSGAGIGMFDGTGDYLAIPDSDDWYFGTNDFTIEFFVNPKAFNEREIFLFEMRTTEYVSPITIWITNSTYSNRYAFALSFSWDLTHMSTTIAQIGRWDHVALVRNGSNFVLYINGVAEHTYSSASSLANISDSLYIGGIPYDASRSLNGYLSEYRISKGIARYTSNFTVPKRQLESDSNTKLLLHFNRNDTTFVDSSPSAHEITAYGNAHQLTSPCESGIVYFDGTGDYLSIPNSTDFVVDTNGITIEGWFKQTGYVGTYKHGAFVSRVYLTPPYPGFWCGVFGDTYTLTVGANNTNINGTTIIALNTWYHFTFYISTSGTIKIWLNGNLETNVTDATVATNYEIQMIVGASGALSNLFNGYLSDVIVTDGDKYGTSNFTPQSTPFKPDPYTKLLLHFDGTGNAFYDSSDPPGDNGFPILPDGVTVTPNGTFTSVKGKDGRNYLKFDGSTNYVLIQDCDAWYFGDNKFTICCWYKSSTTSVAAQIVGQLATNVTGTWSVRHGCNDTNQFGFYYNAAGTEYMIQSAIAMNDSTWRFLTVIRDGTSLKLYINNVLIITGTLVAGAFANNASALEIGRNDVDEAFCEGNIKDLMIFKGTALSLDQLGQIYDETFIY